MPAALRRVKEPLRAGGDVAAPVHATLAYVLEHTLRLLHPVMPFLTEEAWQHLPHEGDSIMVAPWPERRDDLRDDEAEADMSVLIDVVRTVRSIKVDMGLATEAAAVALRADEPMRRLLDAQRGPIVGLGRISELSLDGDRAAHAAAGTAGPIEVFVALEADQVAKARARVDKEMAGLDKTIAQIEGRLRNAEFTARARADVVQADRERLAETVGRRDALTRYLESLT